MNVSSPGAIALHNRAALKQLIRSINISQGEFSLTLARCSNSYWRQHMMEQVQQQSAVPVKVIHLPWQSHSLDEAIQTQIDEQVEHRVAISPAVMVSGLESVVALERLLVAADMGREQLRKQCPFPVVLWLSDRLLKKLILYAPGLWSWAGGTVNFRALIDSYPHHIDNKRGRSLVTAAM